MKAFILNYQEIIFSITSLIISLVAVCISIRQTKLSNKHQLFDRRLKIYSILNEFMVNIELIKVEPKLKEIHTIGEAQQLMLALWCSKSFNDCFNLYISDREYICLQKYFGFMDLEYDYMNEAELIFPAGVGKNISRILHNYIQLINQCVGYHNAYVKEVKNNLDRDGAILESNFSKKYREREVQYIFDINTEYDSLKNAYKIFEKEKLDKRIRKLIKL